MFKATHISIKTIPSDNNQKGIFANRSIKKNTNLGISHYIPPASDQHLFDEGLIRTATGAFINHSKNNNCILRKSGNTFYLITSKIINPSEELFIDYSLYRCGNNYDLSKFI